MQELTHTCCRISVVLFLHAWVGHHDADPALLHQSGQLTGHQLPAACLQHILKLILNVWVQFQQFSSICSISSSNTSSEQFLSQWALRLKQFPRFHREASLILENLSSVILLIFHLRDWDNLLQSRDLRTCLLAVLWLSTMVDASHIKMLTLLSVKQQRVYPLQDFALIPTGTSVMQK